MYQWVSAVVEPVVCRYSLRCHVCSPRGVGLGLWLPRKSQAAQALGKVWAVTCACSPPGGRCYLGLGPQRQCFVCCQALPLALAVASGLSFLLWDHKQQSHLMPAALLLVWPVLVATDGHAAIVCWLHGVKNGLGRKISFLSGTASLFPQLPQLCRTRPLRVSLQQPAPVLSPGAETWAWASAPRPFLCCRQACQPLSGSYTLFGNDLCGEFSPFCLLSTGCCTSVHPVHDGVSKCAETFPLSWLPSQNAAPHPEIFSFFLIFIFCPISF